MKELDIKVRLQNVLQAPKFCCACLNGDSVMYSFEDSLEISDNETSITSTIGYVVQSLFGDQAPQFISSRSICECCKIDAITSFSFIQNTKRIAKMFDDFASQLVGRLEDIEKMIETSNDFGNTLIVLNQPLADIHNEMKALQQECPHINNSKIKQIDDKISQPNNLQTECQKKTKESTYKCEYCKKSFATKKGIVCHIIKVHNVKSRANQKNNKKFTRSIRKRSIRKQECPDCSNSHCEHMKYIESYLIQRESGSKQINCPDCDYVCYTKAVLISHVNKVHLKVFKFKCKHCDKLLHSKYAYKRHLSSFHTLQECCAYCEKKFIFTNNLVKHQELCKRVTRPYKCDQCKVSVDSKEKLTCHLKKHISHFPCPLCNKVLSTEGYLKYHLSIHKTEINKRFKTYNYRCLLCKATFTNGRERKKHMQEHEPGDKAICHYCNKQFDTIRECRQHLLNCRSNRRPCNECHYCSFTTTASYNLEAHINRYHLKVAPYECGKCDKRFTNRPKLIDHEKTHEDVKTHMCQVCERQFRGPTALKNHMRLHTGERPYLCELCGENFISSTVRNLHVLKRHSTKSVECPLCHMKFFTLPSMRTHFKQVHWKHKGKPFDVKKVEGLKEEDYDLFRDRRLLTLN